VTKRLTDADLGIAPAAAQSKRLSDADMGIIAAPTAPQGQETLAQYLGGMGESVLQGLTLGFADEAHAVGKGARSAVGWDEGTFSDAYARDMAAQKAKREAFEGAHPVASTVANIGGGLATGGASLYGQTAKIAAMPLMARIGLGATEGATLGSLAGAGTADPGLENRSVGAITGATIGAPLGAVIPAAGVGAGYLGRGARHIYDVTIGNPKNPALRKVEANLKADEVDPQQLLTDYRKNQFEQRKPEALADIAGENTRQAAAGAATVPGSKAKQMAGGPLVERQMGRLDDPKVSTGQVARVERDAERALKAKPFNDTEEALIQQRATEARPLYEQAYKIGPLWNEELDAILNRPSVGKAWLKAQKFAADEGTPLPKLFETNDKGEIVEVLTVPDMRAWDLIKQGLDDVVEGFRDPVTRKIVNAPREAQGAMSARADLVKILDELNPDYAPARQAYAGRSASLEALRFGRSILNENAEIIESQIAKLSPGDREFFNAGVLQAIRDKVGATANTGDAVAKILGNVNLRRRLGAAMDEKQFRVFIKQLEREQAQTRTLNATRGSNTANKMGEMGNLTEMVGTAADAGAGNVQALLARALMAVQRNQPGAKRIADELGPMYYEPAMVEPTLEQIIASQNRLLGPNRYTGLIEALTRTGSMQGGAAPNR
jgi:hypothetical protein